jgi:hypothetical protein
MRMTLARKDLIAHVELVKAESEMTDDWHAADLEALAIIAQGITLEHRTKIRRTATTKQAWDTLREFSTGRSCTTAWC